MDLVDIPIVVSNMRASLTQKGTSTLVITTTGKGHKISIPKTSIDATLATSDAFYMKFNRPLRCNPRSSKPKQSLAIKTDHVGNIAGAITPTFDTRSWKTEPFLSWGYNTKLFVSPADFGVLTIADAHCFSCLNVCEVSSVEFLRMMPGTRSFDVAFLLEDGERHVVENIDKSELPRLSAQLEALGLSENCSESSGEESESEASDWCDEGETSSSSDDLCSSMSSDESI